MGESGVYVDQPGFGPPLGRTRVPGLVNDFDLVTPGNSELLWVNSTNRRLASSRAQTSSSTSRLISPFPFSRLAVTNRTVPNGFDVLTSEEYYLYHQINETAFAEDRFEVAGDAWISKNITLGS